MPGTAKILRSNLGSACFFFKLELFCFKQNFRLVMYLLMLSAYLSHLGLFFLLRNFFLLFLSVFDVLIQFLLLLFSLRIAFFVFFVSLKNFLGPNFFSLFLSAHGTILGRFKGKTILILPSALFNLVVCLPIGLLNFLSWKINSFKKVCGLTFDLYLFSQNLPFSSLSF